MRFNSVLVPVLAIASGCSGAALAPTKTDIYQAADTYYELAQAAGCDWLGKIRALQIPTRG